MQGFDIKCFENGATKQERSMRHNNQQGRRFRGRNNGHGNNHGGNHGGQHNNGQRRINPRVQTFDSNGPDVRIRGNAIQIAEKYMGLARDAAAAGDRVLAESYYQHAEHYQRMLNEAAEEQNRYMQQQQQYQQQQPAVEGEGFVQEGVAVDLRDQPQPSIDTDSSPVLSDLDQSFLVGPRGGVSAVQAEQPAGETGAVAPRAGRRSFRPKEVESA